MLCCLDLKVFVLNMWEGRKEGRMEGNMCDLNVYIVEPNPCFNA
jgi:hypothetical protein